MFCRWANREHKTNYNQCIQCSKSLQGLRLNGPPTSDVGRLTGGHFDRDFRERDIRIGQHICHTRPCWAAGEEGKEAEVTYLASQRTPSL